MILSNTKTIIPIGENPDKLTRSERANDFNTAPENICSPDFARDRDFYRNPQIMPAVYRGKENRYYVIKITDILYGKVWQKTIVYLFSPDQYTINKTPEKWRESEEEILTAKRKKRQSRERRRKNTAALRL